MMPTASSRPRGHGIRQSPKHVVVTVSSCGWACSSSILQLEALVLKFYRQAGGYEVTGIDIMAVKPAFGAGEAHLRWPEDRLRETEEQRHPDQHDADGEQPPEGTRHRDVAKTRRCQRRHGEIERVEVAIDLGIAAVLDRKSTRLNSSH